MAVEESKVTTEVREERRFQGWVNEGVRGDEYASPLLGLSLDRRRLDGKARECLLLPQLEANQYSRFPFAATLPSARFCRGGCDIAARTMETSTGDS